MAIAPGLSFGNVCYYFKHMRRKVLSALALVSMTASASQEGALAFASLHFVSKGIGQSGVVQIDATQDDTGVQSFVVQAFGRTYRLTDSQLRELGTAAYNSIQVSSDSGGGDPDGRILYIQVSMAFTSGAVQSRYVVIKESGAAAVRDKVR